MEQLSPFDELAKSLPNCYDAIFKILKYYLLPRCDASCSKTSIANSFYNDVLIENCGPEYWSFVQNIIPNPAITPVILGQLEGDTVTVACVADVVGDFANAGLQFEDSTSDSMLFLDGDGAASPFTLDPSSGACGLPAWTAWEEEKREVELHNEGISNNNGTNSNTNANNTDVENNINDQSINKNTPITMPYPSHRLFFLLLSPLASFLGQFAADFLGKRRKRQ